MSRLFAVLYRLANVSAKMMSAHRTAIGITMGRLARATAEIINDMLGKVGFAVCSKETITRRQRLALRGALEHLRHVGLTPATIIDAGVAFGTPELYETFPDANHLLVEPLVEFQPFLDKITHRYRSVQVVAAAVGSTPGTIMMHVPPNLDASTTVFNREHVHSGQQRAVPVIRLDDEIRERGLPGPYIIKLDIEGAELDALSGAEQTLIETEIVVMETALYEFRPGAPQIAEVIAFMKERGFVVYDISAPQYRLLDNAMAQVDIAFAREDGTLRKSHRSASADQTAQAHRAFEKGFQSRTRALR